MKITAVIVAAGSGKRMCASENKVFLKLAGKRILEYTVEAFERCNRVDNIVLVTRECDIPFCRDIKAKKLKRIIAGGRERQESVYFGLCEAEGDIVLIHDGARPFVSDSEINNVIDDCMRYGAAAVGVKCKDTLKTIDVEGMISSTSDREHTYMIQTPQAFYLSDILREHERARAAGVFVTDDCALMEMAGKKIKVTDGSYDNIKLTTPEDLAVGEMILKRKGGF